MERRHNLGDLVLVAAKIIAVIEEEKNLTYKITGIASRGSYNYLTVTDDDIKGYFEEKLTKEE